jgi:hypothetical protein
MYIVLFTSMARNDIKLDTTNLYLIIKKIRLLVGPSISALNFLSNLHGCHRLVNQKTVPFSRPRRSLHENIIPSSPWARTANRLSSVRLGAVRSRSRSRSCRVPKDADRSDQIVVQHKAHRLHLLCPSRFS